jgi:hypothetical protein
MKKPTSFRNSLFFLLGALIYSLFFWLSKGNDARVYGAILTALACYIVYKITHPSSHKHERVCPSDVIYMGIGVIFNSFSGGFPLGGYL